MASTGPVGTTYEANTIASKTYPWIALCAAGCSEILLIEREHHVRLAGYRPDLERHRQTPGPDPSRNLYIDLEHSREGYARIEHRCRLSADHHVDLGQIGNFVRHG